MNKQQEMERVASGPPTGTPRYGGTLEELSVFAGFRCLDICNELTVEQVNLLPVSVRHRMGGWAGAVGDRSAAGDAMSDYDFSETQILSLDSTVDGKHTTQVAAVHPELGYVGAVDVQWEAEFTGFVTRLYVEPGCRRQGIARMLLDWCAGLAAERKRVNIALLVAPDNREVVPIYLKCGFVLVCEYPDRALLLVRKAKV